MDWKRYYIGINHNSTGLFIGTGDMTRNGTIKYTSKSGDRTYEMVNAVGKFMRIKLDRQDKKMKRPRHWYGFDLQKVGKLVLIQPGYDFQVIKHVKDAPERPVQNLDD